MSAQWKPEYHGPACQGPQHPSEDFTKDQALQAWRASPRVFPSARDLSSRGHRAKGSARPPASRGFLPQQAGSVSSTERTWALRFPQSHGRAKARWRQRCRAILVYKGVNKAAPSKGGPRRATLVIRRPSAAADEGDVTMGRIPSSCSAGPPSWLDGGFSSFGDAAPAMDRVHGLHLYRAPYLLLRRYVVTLPAKIFGGRGPGRL